MARLYKETQWLRRTLTTRGEWIISPQMAEEIAREAPAGGYVRATICIPADPAVEVALDTEPSVAAARDSYWPAPPLNKTLCLTLLPTQTVCGRATIEISEVSVILEFWAP